MNRLWSLWRNYWFRPAPVLNLAVARLAAVGFQLFNIVFLIRPLTQIFPDLSHLRHLYHPIALLRAVFRPIDPAWFPPIGALHAIFWITVVAGVLALVGLFTNVSLGAFALGSAVIQGYAYSFNEVHHGEAIMAFALFFLTLSPCGRMLSLDRLFLRLRETIERRHFVPAAPLDERSEAARWPILALVWMFSLIYFSAAYFKFRLAGLDWMNGYTMRYYLLQDGLRWDLSLALVMARHQIPAVLMSVGSVLFESTFFLVILFPPLVWVYAMIGLMMHGAIHFLMRANFWEFMVLYLAIVPWTDVARRVKARAAARAATRPPLELLYDGQCFLCLRSVTVIDALDWFGRVRLSAFQDPAAAARGARLGITPTDTRRELHLILPDGKIFRGFFAFRRLSWVLPGLLPLAPFLYLPGAGVVGPMVYAFVARNRRRFETCENDACRI